jgi:superfamily II DNA or RNA helicase
VTPTPFQYQARDIERLSQTYRRAARVVYVLPTGGGKTFVFSDITRRVVARGGRVLILVHRQELLQQASASLSRLGVAHGLIQAGRPMDIRQLVQVASVQTLVRRLDEFPSDAFRLVIIDEAHHAVAGTWARVLEHFSPARLLGVTATPIRGDGRGLGEVFEAMVLGPSAAELTEMGHLARARVFAPPIGFSAKGLRTRMGDFDQEEAGQRLMVTKVMGSAVGHYQQHLRGGTAVAFCCSIRHAEATAEAFRAAGVRAASIDGTTPNRGELLRDLGTGALQVLTSCDLIGEGINVPSVSGCILLRPTQSEGLHLQMIGRCLRPAEGKDAAVVLDHVGNVARLGHHLEDREWTLNGVRKRAREGGPAVPVRECPVCYAAMAGGVPICEECGHVFVLRTAIVQTVEGQLQEVLMQRQERKREQASARSFDDLVEVGRRRGMQNPHGWARHVMTARGRR